jgi:hypothetical protein
MILTDMTLSVIIFNFKGNEPQQSSSETDEQLSAQDHTSTCQFAQQTPSRAEKRKANEDQAQSSSVSFLLIAFI